jgi:hypothetical protein
MSDIDSSFLSWVAAHTNGANVHDSNMLLSNYKYYLKADQLELAEVTKRMLTKFLLSGHGKVRGMIGQSTSPMITQFRIWEENQN